MMPLQLEDQQRWFSPAGGVTALLSLACLLALLLHGLIAANMSVWTQMSMVAIMLLTLLTLDHLVLQHYGEKPPRSVAQGALLLHLLLVEIVTLVDGLTYTSLLYLTLPFPAFFLAGRRIGLGLSIGLLGWFTFKFVLLKPGGLANPDMVNTYLLFFIALILVAAMAQVVQRERAHRQHVEALLHKLESSQRQIAELATIEERNRLAREIHDSLGHYLTVIGVQLEKALLVFEDRRDAALTAINHAKRLTDQALTDVRQSVSTLRREAVPFHLQTALETMVANLQGLSLQVNLNFQGEEAAFSRQQLMTLYRAVQEGLTNVQKHAHARCVSITVTLAEQEARLTVQDDGIGLKAGGSAGGFGLRSVQERLELVSGRLVIAALPEGGTRLFVTIPRVNPVMG